MTSQYEMKLQNTDGSWLARKSFLSLNADVLSSRTSLSGHLRDYCPACKKEISALLVAFDAGAPKAFANVSSSSLDAALARFATRLENDYALSASAARWAAESWAMALGVLREDKMPSSSFALSSGEAALAPLAPSAGPAPETAAAQCVQGDIHYAGGDYENAVPWYRKAGAKEELLPTRVSHDVLTKTFHQEGTSIVITPAIASPPPQDQRCPVCAVAMPEGAVKCTVCSLDLNAFKKIVDLYELAVSESSKGNWETVGHILLSFEADQFQFHSSTTELIAGLSELKKIAIEKYGGQDAYKMHATASQASGSPMLGFAKTLTAYQKNIIAGGVIATFMIGGTVLGALFIAEQSRKAEEIQKQLAIETIQRKKLEAEAEHRNLEEAQRTAELDRQKALDAVAKKRDEQALAARRAKEEEVRKEAEHQRQAEEERKLVVENARKATLDSYAWVGELVSTVDVSTIRKAVTEKLGLDETSIGRGNQMTEAQILAEVSKKCLAVAENQFPLSLKEKCEREATTLVNQIMPGERISYKNKINGESYTGVFSFVTDKYARIGEKRILLIDYPELAERMVPERVKSRYNNYMAEHYFIPRSALLKTTEISLTHEIFTSYGFVYNTSTSAWQHASKLIDAKVASIKADAKKMQEIPKEIAETNARIANAQFSLFKSERLYNNSIEACRKLPRFTQLSAFIIAEIDTDTYEVAERTYSPEIGYVQSSTHAYLKKKNSSISLGKIFNGTVYSQKKPLTEISETRQGFQRNWTVYEEADPEDLELIDRRDASSKKVNEIKSQIEALTRERRTSENELQNLKCSVEKYCSKPQ